MQVLGNLLPHGVNPVFEVSPSGQGSSVPVVKIYIIILTFGDITLFNWFNLFVIFF